MDDQSKTDGQPLDLAVWVGTGEGVLGLGDTRQPNLQGSTAEETPTLPKLPPLGQRSGRELQPLGPGRP